MKFLIDNQLPAALARHLRSHGHDAVHVAEFGLDAADDRAIWRHAGDHCCVIVSKDEDFLHLSMRDQAGPGFVWVRLGNCRTPALLAAFDRLMPNLLVALVAGQRVVEIR